MTTPVFYTPTGPVTAPVAVPVAPDAFATPSMVAEPEPAPVAAAPVTLPTVGQPATGTDPFASPGSIVDGPRTTDHHKFPLPPRLRAYEPDRDRFGRYLLPNPVTGKTEGGTRTTTLADTLDDTYNLEQWRLRSVIRGLKTDPDMLEDVDLFGEWRDVNADIDRLTERAMVAAGTAHGRELGTAVHEWLEVIDADKLTLSDVPDVFRPKCAAYLETIRTAGIEPIAEHVERIVRNEHRKVTGTYDRIYRLPDGSLVIGDVKTGRDLTYSYMAISAQLAAYADAEHLLSADGTTWLPMPDVRKDYAVVLHVPSDQDVATVVTIDLEFGRRTLDYATAVRELRTQAKKSVPNVWTLPPAPVVTQPEPTAAPAVDAGPTQWIAGQIRACGSKAEIGRLWEEYAPYWTDELTALGNARLAELATSAQVNPFA